MPVRVAKGVPKIWAGDTRAEATPAAGYEGQARAGISGDSSLGNEIFESEKTSFHKEIRTPTNVFKDL